MDARLLVLFALLSVAVGQQFRQNQQQFRQNNFQQRPQQQFQQRPQQNFQQRPQQQNFQQRPQQNFQQQNFQRPQQQFQQQPQQQQPVANQVGGGGGRYPEWLDTSDGKYAPFNGPVKGIPRDHGGGKFGAADCLLC